MPLLPSQQTVKLIIDEMRLLTNVDRLGILSSFCTVCGDTDPTCDCGSEYDDGSDDEDDDE